MKRKDKYIVIILSSIICLIFFLGRLKNQLYFQYLGAILSAIICLVSKKDYLFLCAIIPNTYYCMIGGSAISGYLAILIVLKQLLVGSFRIKWAFYVGAIPFVFSFALSMFATGNFSLAMTIVKTIAMCLLFFLVFSKSKNKEEKRIVISDLSFFYIFGAFLFSIFGILFYIVQGNSILAFDIYSTRFSGLAEDPNYMSAILCLAIALVFAKLIIFKRFNIFFAIALIVFVLSGLVSLSRGFMLTSVILFIMLVLDILFFKGFSTKVRFLFLTGTFALSLLILIFGYEPISMVLLRSEDAIYAGGSGRTELWSWYIKEVFSSPLSALIGRGNAWSSISSGLVHNVEHNTFIQILFQTGIIGSFFYFFLFYKLSKMSKGALSLRAGLLIPLLSTIIPYSLLSAISGENFIFAMIISFSFLFYPLEKGRKDLSRNG